MQTTLQGSIINVTGFFNVCFKFWNDLPVRLQWHDGNETTGYRSVPASQYRFVKIPVWQEWQDTRTGKTLHEHLLKS